MNEIVHTDWIGKMMFDSEIDGRTIHFDVEEQLGGTQSGYRPKPLVLSALAACTGMDVVSILGKKQVIFTTIRISADGELAEEQPKIYRKIHLVFFFTGPDFSDNEEIMIKVNRAVRLSLDKYCAVSGMLKNSCEITDEIILLNS